MVSIQEPGTVEIYVKDPSTNARLSLYRANVADSAPGGGAPDGALASVVTPERRRFVPTNPNMLRPNDVVYVEFTAVGADGIDVSDCVWIIPFTLQNGNVISLSQADFTVPAAADYTTVAAIPVVVAGHRVLGNMRFGGGPLYLDIQDDTV